MTVVGYLDRLQALAEGVNDPDEYVLAGFLFSLGVVGLGGAEDCRSVARDILGEWPLFQEHSSAILTLVARLRGVEDALSSVLALHYEASNTADREPICPECRGRAGEHPCGCWAGEDSPIVCAVCNTHEYHPTAVAYPCPTVAAVRAARAGEGGWG